MKNLYDELLKSIKGCVRAVPFQKLADCKHIIAIAVNEEGIIKEFLCRIFALSDTIEIVFIAQPKAAKILRTITDKNIYVVEWQGTYTNEVTEVVNNQLGASEWDGFLYFCDQPINLRNMNILNIAEAFKVRKDYSIYGVDIEGTLYEYQNIALYNRGIHLYEEVNTFISMCSESEKYD